MTKKLTPVEEAVASSVDWNITFNGHTYPLTPSMQAIRMLERGCGRTLFNIIEVAKANTLSIDDLAIIVSALIVGDDFSRIRKLHDSRLATHLTAHAPIFEFGLLQTFNRILPPLVAALVGSVDADGVPVGLKKAA